MRTRTTAVLLTALAGLLLAGCGNGPTDADPPDQPPTETPAPPVTPPVTPPVPSPPVTPPPVPPAPPEGEVTLTGEVISGVEPGCVLLETDAGQFLLFGEAAEQVQVGATATVRGEAKPDMATTCQQGVPFEVSAVID